MTTVIFCDSDERGALGRTFNIAPNKFKDYGLLEVPQQGSVLPLWGEVELIVRQKDTRIMLIVNSTHRKGGSDVLVELEKINDGKKRSNLRLDTWICHYIYSPDPYSHAKELAEKLTKFVSKRTEISVCLFDLTFRRLHQIGLRPPDQNWFWTSPDQWMRGLTLKGLTEIPSIWASSQIRELIDRNHKSCAATHKQAVRLNATQLLLGNLIFNPTPIPPEALFAVCKRMGFNPDVPPLAPYCSVYTPLKNLDYALVQMEPFVEKLIRRCNAGVEIYTNIWILYETAVDRDNIRHIISNNPLFVALKGHRNWHGTQYTQYFERPY